MSIDVRASLDAVVAPDVLFSVVRNLETFPLWLDVVHRVEKSGSNNPDDSNHDDSDHDDSDNAWDVELRAKIGPFARSKRLRMVRSLDERPKRVVFERQELDGKKHAPWVLTCEIAERDKGCSLYVQLRYGGSLFDGGVVERVLADQIESGKVKLTQFLAGL